jgi:hypothetical protein
MLDGPVQISQLDYVMIDTENRIWGRFLNKIRAPTFVSSCHG